MARLIAWSYSRLSDFEQCPFMFYHKHITKQFKVDWDAPHIINGRNVHKMFEDAIRKGTGLSESYRAFNHLIIALRAKAAIAEKEFTWDAQGRMVSWFDKNAYFRQKLDVICSDVRPTSAIIIDWKTGKVRDQETDQLRLYGGVLMKAQPELQEVYTAYVWLDHPDVPPTIQGYNRSEYQDIWESFEERADAIQRANQSGNWPKKPGFQCPWCPALPTQCEHAKNQ